MPDGQARAEAEKLAAALARFPPTGLRQDRRSVLEQAGLDEPAALRNEHRLGLAALPEAAAGAARFAAGAGRHGAPEGGSSTGGVVPAE